MAEMQVIGKGRLQLRQSGKHLLLTQGRKGKATRFRADDFVDNKVIVYVEVVSSEKIQRRRSSPRF